jgi:hypothetical protein
MKRALCAINNARGPVISAYSGRASDRTPAYAAGVDITHRTLNALKRRGLVKVVRTDPGRHVLQYGQRGHRVVHWVDLYWELTDAGRAATTCTESAEAKPRKRKARR